MVVVAVNTDSGPGTIQIEVPELPPTDLSEIYGDEATRGVGRKVISLARPLFSEAVDLVGACAAEMKQRLDQMSAESRPSELEMQFAVKLDAGLGASIVTASGGAQLQICLRWRGTSGD
jgi:NTP-dependent ternary system trypsin peptidase co-occuring protein